MHTISSVSVKNFRSILDQSFELNPCTPIVGRNNTGKSNLLQAIQWCLKKSTLTENDFNTPDQPVEVTMKIDGISKDVLGGIDKKHRNAIEAYVIDASLTIRRIQPSPSSKAVEIKLFLRGEDEEWNANPSGIDNAIKALLPEPILIKAMDNAAEDTSKNSATSTIGRLLKDILPSLNSKYSKDISDALSDIKEQISSDGKNRDADLEQADKGIGDALNDFFPGLSPTIEIPIPEFTDVFKSATLKLKENGEHRDVASMGHGAQRSLQMALIKHLSTLQNGGSAQTTLLLIDEPELYLHPQAIETVRIALRDLTTNGYQVVFTTHSASMIKQENIKNTLIFRKDVKKGSHTLPTMRTTIQSIMANHQHQTDVIFELHNASEFLFSDKVLLMEGKTENILIPKAYETYHRHSMAFDGVAAISVGGSPNLKNAKEILNAMGFSTFILADLDYIYKQRKTLLPDGELENAKTFFANHSDITRGDDGLPKRNGNTTAADCFALYAQDAGSEDRMQAVHADCRMSGIWVWKHGTIETQFNISGKTPEARKQ
ncbi:MAG: ATP-dependent nuclease [Halocynthiibacter sp.]